MATSELMSLPAWTYSNPKFHELELQHLFRPAWHLVCHLSNIEADGDYFTFEIMNESVVVLPDGKDIRAFHNVCRHRGARLLDGPSGRIREKITCSYHAWIYGMDGSLKKLPDRDQFDNLVPGDHGLAPIELEIFLGFVFVRFQKGGDFAIHSNEDHALGTTVAEQFAPALPDLLPYRFEELKPLGSVTLLYRDVNWKQIADNYVDALHIPVAHPIAHPGLSSLMGNS